MNNEEALNEVLRDAIARASHDRSDLKVAAEEAARAFKAGLDAYRGDTKLAGCVIEAASVMGGASGYIPSGVFNKSLSLGDVEARVCKLEAIARSAATSVSGAQIGGTGATSTCS